MTCCNRFVCRLSKEEWDGNTDNIVEVKAGVTGSTSVAEIDDDGTTIGTKDTEAVADIVPWPIIPPQPTSLEVATDLVWDGDSDSYQEDFYLWGQTYDELMWQPTGYDIKWWGSIDYSLRYLEKRYDSESETDILEYFSDASIDVHGDITGVAGTGGSPNYTRIESEAHGRSAGDSVTIADVGGSTEANGIGVIISNVPDADHFDVEIVHKHPYSSGGTWTLNPSDPLANIEQVEFVLMARQGSTTYYKTWNQDSPIGTYFRVEGKGGKKWVASDDPDDYRRLFTGDWFRYAHHLTTSLLNTADTSLFPGGYWDEDHSPHSWRKAELGLWTDHSIPYLEPAGDLDWCADADPIYFGWGIRFKVTQTTHIEGYGYPTPYRLDKMIKQTIRVDRICINLIEQPTTQCDMCTGTTDYIAAYNSGYSGPMHWQFDSSDCSAGCERTPSTGFGTPAHIYDTLSLPCRPAWNNPPVGHSNAVDTPQNTPYVFDAADFGFTDPNDSPPNDFLAVKITTLPGRGVLSVDGSDILLPGLFVSVADIDDGLLMFTPRDDDVCVPPSNYDFFTFQVQDDGGTDHDASDIDATARTMSITVTGDLQPPVGRSKTVTMKEDQLYSFKTNDWGFTDPHNVIARSFAYVKITTLPAVGVLKLSGVAVTAGQFIPISAFGSNLFKFTSVQYERGASYTTFTFQVQSDGDISGGGSNLDPNPKTMTIDVVSVNNAPVGTANTVKTRINHPYVFQVEDFGFTDPHDDPPNGFLQVLIASEVTAGELNFNGFSAFSFHHIVTVQELIDGKLIFTPEDDESGDAYATFTFKVWDDGGELFGGSPLDATARTMTIDVTLNHAPLGASTTVTTDENVPYVFQVEDFGFTDPDDDPADRFKGIVIATLPAAGVLTNNYTPVSASDFVTFGSLSLGRLAFTPALDEFGAGYATLTFQVRDNGGTDGGGEDTDATPKTITIDVDEVV